MKMRKITKSVLAVAFLSAFVFATGLLVKMNSVVVKAESTVTIEMCSGASIKLTDEHKGMRFMAKINNYDAQNDTLSFGMIIIPEEYLSLQEVKDAGDSPDYIAIFSQKGLPLWNCENMVPKHEDNAQFGEGDYIKGVITDVKYNNLNRNFYGIGYIDNGETKVYTAIDKTSNARAFSQVVESVINDDEAFSGFTEEEKQTVLGFKHKAINSLNGVAEAEVKEYDGEKQLAIYSELKGSNVLASFNKEGYLDLAYSKTHAWGETVTKSIATFENKQVLKLEISSKGESESGKYNSAYGNVHIDFLNNPVVTENTVITYKAYGDNSRTFYLGVGETQYQTEFGGLGLWIVGAVKATSIGFNVGDKLTGINVYVANDNGANKANQQNSTFYLDELAYTEDLQSETLSLSKYGYGTYASYDTLSSVLDKHGVSFYDDGETVGVIYPHASGMTVTTPFNAEHTVRQGDILKVRYKLIISTGSQFLKKNGSLQGVGRYDKAFTEVTLSLTSDLGYSVGDKISSLSIKNLGKQDYVVFDYIKIENDEYEATQNLIDKLGTNHLASFNDDGYLSLMGKSSLTDGTWSWHSSITGLSIENDTLKISKLDNIYYASFKLKFPKAIEVTEELVIKIRVKSEYGSIYLAKYGTDSTGTKLSAVKGEWTEVEFVPVENGYTVGESLVGFEINFGTTCGNYNYIDYISYGDRYKINKELTENQVANFDDAEYAKYVSRGTVAEGLWTVTSGYDWIVANVLKNYVDGQYVYHTVPDTATGKEGYVAVRIKTSAPRVRFYKGEAERATTPTGSRDLIHTNSSDWVISSTGAWQTIIVPLTQIGYSVGDEFTKIAYNVWGNSAQVDIDYIDYVELNAGITNKATALAEYNKIKLSYALTGNQVANFDDERYIDYVGLSGVKSATSNEYYTHGYYYTAKSIQGGALTVKSSSKYFASVGITLVKQLKVTDDLVINIKIKSGSGSLSVAKLGADSTGTEISGVVKGDWAIVSFYATDIGYSVDEVIKGLDLYFGANSGEYNYIDYIDYSIVNKYALNDKLTGNQVANFDDADYTSFNESVTIIDDDGNSVMQAKIGSGVSLEVNFAKSVTATSKITVKIKSGSIVALIPNSGSNRSL